MAALSDDDSYGRDDAYWLAARQAIEADTAAIAPEDGSSYYANNPDYNPDSDHNHGDFSSTTLPDFSGYDTPDDPDTYTSDFVETHYPPWKQNIMIECGRRLFRVHPVTQAHKDHVIHCRIAFEDGLYRLLRAYTTSPTTARMTWGADVRAFVRQIYIPFARAMHVITLPEHHGAEVTPSIRRVRVQSTDMLHSAVQSYLVRVGSEPVDRENHERALLGVLYERNEWKTLDGRFQNAFYYVFDSLCPEPMVDNGNPDANSSHDAIGAAQRITELIARNLKLVAYGIIYEDVFCEEFEERRAYPLHVIAPHPLDPRSSTTEHESIGESTNDASAGESSNAPQRNRLAYTHRTARDHRSAEKQYGAVY